MRFRRTFDYSLVKNIITHPKLYRWLSDDFSSAPDEFWPVESDLIWYVLVKEEDEVLGLFMFVPHSWVLWEVHTCLLPAAWGPRAEAAAKGMSEWIWKNTTCQRIITSVPAYNRLALRFAKAAGMKQFGVNEKAFQKNGKLHDVVLLGMSKGEQ